MAFMKTTLDLPEDLMKAIKIRAVQENRKLKDTIADLLRRGLAQESQHGPVRQRVKLPLIECSHVAEPDEEMTPDRAAAVLLEEESEAEHGPLR